jgi:cation transport ATPase
VLNEETVKAMVIDMLRCTNDTNLQHTYVGDGVGDLELADLGIAPIALTDRSNPSAKMLLKQCLHEVKAFYLS